jgi:hypothetical protein
VFWLCVANRLPIDGCMRAELHNFAPSLEWLACASRAPDVAPVLHAIGAQFFECATEQQRCNCSIVVCDVMIPDMPGCPTWQSQICPSGGIFYYRCDGAGACSDGYDQRNCDRSAPAYECADGEFVAWTAVCDGTPDCVDAIDEFTCEAATR